MTTDSNKPTARAKLEAIIDQDYPPNTHSRPDPSSYSMIHRQRHSEISKLHSERNKVIDQIREHSPRKNMDKYQKVTFNDNVLHSGNKSRDREYQMLKNFSFQNNMDIYEKVDGKR